jgi:hypothetical protein
MFPHHLIKTIFGKVSRSGLYYLLIWHLPVGNGSDRETQMDALGGLTVVGLLAGMVGLMRLLLVN